MCESYDIKTLTSDELKHFIDTHPEGEYEIIDVRQPEEYVTGHIPGSQLIPVPDIVSDPSRLPNDKDLIFYCQSGQRSHSASIMAYEEKISNHTVYHLEGGIMSWEGKTLLNYPRFEVFDSSYEVKDFALTAMKLEKSAHVFYIMCYRQFKEFKISGLLMNLSDAEKDHAKIIFERLAYVNNISKNFDAVFKDLSFNTMEGGKKLTDTLQIMKSYSSPCIEIIDIALAIEYSAFDLYRNMADNTEIAEIKNLFYSLSQEEKEHMKTIIKGIELL